MSDIFTLNDANFRLAMSKVVSIKLPSDFADTINNLNLGKKAQILADELLEELELPNKIGIIEATYKTFWCMCWKTYFEIEESLNSKTELTFDTSIFEDHLDLLNRSTLFGLCMTGDDAEAWLDYLRSQLSEAEPVFLTSHETMCTFAFEVSLSLVWLYLGHKKLEQSDTAGAIDYIFESHQVIENYRRLKSFIGGIDSSEEKEKHEKSLKAKELAILKAQKSPAGKAKHKIKELWEEWQNLAPDRYKNRTQFSIDMIYKFEGVKNPRTIENWCKFEWEPTKEI